MGRIVPNVVINPNNLFTHVKIRNTLSTEALNLDQ